MPTQKSNTKKSLTVAKKSNTQKKYNMKSQYEHILSLPDMYIGSIDSDTIENMWVWNTDEKRMEQRDVKITRGLYKIFDEIIVNSEDQEKRSQMKQLKNAVTKIAVTIDEKTGEISVENNGDGIDVEQYEEYDNIYAPELIFGNLLTSENYDKKGKVTGGKNGLGAKLTNIYSKMFKIETVDAKRGLKYVQTYTNNMLEKTKPKITKYKSAPFTKITFIPDYERFNMPDGMDKDTADLFKKRVYDVCACTKPNVSISLNGKVLNIKSFEQYVNLYIGSNKKAYQRVYESPSSRWDVVVCSNPSFGNLQHVSFVNGINTFQGGKHIQHVATTVAKNMTKLINATLKKDETKVKQAHVTNRLWLFVRCDIEDPSFDSQTKEFLTTPFKKFGSKCEFSKKFYKSLMATDIVEKVLQLSAFSDTAILSKTDGKKSSTLRGIPKLDDANFAGTNKSKECTLILTEGDSAKASAVSAVSAIPKGKDFFGIFPLKGKMLNVRGETLNKVSSNAEVTNIKKILGLQVFEKGNKKLKEYKDTGELRYGRVMIFTDQDVDGSHIRGLFINFIHYYWPQLLDPKIGFVTTVATPIVKVTLNSTANKKKKTQKTFYTLTEYEDWTGKLKPEDVSKWTAKYYKGLGTSTATEAKEFFMDLKTRLVTYTRDEYEIKESLLPDYNGSIATAGKSSTGSGETDLVKLEKSITKDIDVDLGPKLTNDMSESEDETDDEETDDDDEPTVNFSDDRIRLAFDSKQANRRKIWLSNYDRTNILHQTERKVSLQDFVDKELIHFSSSDNNRSIPSMIDGFKPSQRKILYGTIKKNIKGEIKVAQLANYVSEKTAYHHGETSLTGTIVKMAQDFVGSNNINFLYPSGQFGTRLQGGKDAAAARYIFTKLQDITRTIFHPDDEPLLKNVEEDGEIVEPEYYVPVVPTILINGAVGIGTGFSTNVPNYNPIDIVNNIKNRICGEQFDWMKPYYNEFKGEIKWQSKLKKFTTVGVYEVVSETVIKITELPVGTWTENYYEFLDKLIDVNKDAKDYSGLISYRKYHTDVSVEIHLRLNKEMLMDYVDRPQFFIKTFKLDASKPVQTSNMCLHDKNGLIRKYPDVYAIINDFYKVRLHHYQLRKEHKLKELKHDYDVAQARIAFIEGVVNKKIKILNVEEEKIVEQLEKKKFPKFCSVKYDPDAELTGTPSYNYLLTMPIRTLTTAKIDALNKDKDEKWTQYEQLLTKSPKGLWLDDLDDFVNAYKKHQPNDKTKLKKFTDTVLEKVKVCT